MFDDYKLKQPIFYNLIKNAIDCGKVSHAFLIETNGVEYIDSMIFSFVKYLLSNNNLNLDNYPDFKIIDSNNKEIKKDDILNLEHLFSVKPIYGKYMIYYIKNVENFNNYSANTILKFLEEPNENIIAILTTSNINSVLDTIVSRCQIFSLIGDSNNYIRQLFSNDEEYNEFMNNNYERYIDFFVNIELNKTSIIGNKDFYFEKENLRTLVYFGLYFYLDLLYYIMHIDKGLNFDYNNKTNLIDKLNEEVLIKRLDIIFKYMDCLNLNLNKDLFIDNFIIDLCGGIYD